MNRKFFKILIVAVNVFIAVAFSIIGSRISFRAGMQKQLKNTADKKILEFDIGLKDQISLSTQMAKSPLIIS
ncbi:MAG: hypothetical protein K6F69_10950, partial [Treponema sp.]|nr:hypothetical protein [Treponema sp.]